MDVLLVHRVLHAAQLEKELTSASTKQVRVYIYICIQTNRKMPLQIACPKSKSYSNYVRIWCCPKDRLEPCQMANVVQATLDPEY